MHAKNFRLEQEARNMLSMHGIDVPSRLSMMPAISN